jgi:hypothetical protein
MTGIAHAADLLLDECGRFANHPQKAESAGGRDCRDQFGTRDASHSSENDWKLAP